MSRTGVVLPLALVLVIGCGPEGSPEASISIPALPDLSDADPSVIETFQEAEAAAAEALATGEPDGSEAGEAVGRLGMVFDAFGYAERAQNCYRTAQSLSDSTDRWTYHLALVARRSGGTQEAIAGLEVVAASSNYVPAMLWRAEIARQAGQMQLAQSWFERAQSRQETAYGFFGLGSVFFEQGDAETAIAMLEMGRALRPDSDDLLYSLGRAYIAADRKDEGRELIAGIPNTNMEQNRLLIDDPWQNEITAIRRTRSQSRAVRYHERRAVEAMGKQQFGVASAEMRQALQLDPDNVAARHNLAISMLGMGQRRQGMAELMEVVERDPAHAPSWVLLGRLRSDDGDAVGAEEAFGRALATDPDSELGRRGLADLMRHDGRCEEALVHYRSAIELQPHRGEARIGLAECLAELGRVEEARHEVREAQQIVPGNETLAELAERLEENPF